MQWLCHLLELLFSLGLSPVNSMIGNFACYFFRINIFNNKLQQKNKSGYTISVSNSLDPNQVGCLKTVHKSHQQKTLKDKELIGTKIKIILFVYLVQ